MTSAIDSMSELSQMSQHGPLGLGSVAQNVVLAVSFTALPFFGSSAGQIQVPTIRDLMSSSWAQSGSAGTYLIHVPVVAEEAAASVACPVELLVETRETSGLTWDQLARYFGVSRRAVHLWAAGGRMSAANEELLAHLVRAVDAVRGLEPATRRQALLRPESGLNIIDTERARRSSRDSDINRSPEIGVADDKA
jgi:transcriptional regulator with XRE-family HTH domain